MRLMMALCLLAFAFPASADSPNALAPAACSVVLKSGEQVTIDSPSTYTIAMHTKRGPVRAVTAGDPIMYSAKGLKLGHWPSVDVTYITAGGVEIRAHATGALGDTSSMTVYDKGRAYVFTGVNTKTPKVKVIDSLWAIKLRRAFERRGPTFVWNRSEGAWEQK